MTWRNDLAPKNNNEDNENDQNPSENTTENEAGL